MPTNHRLILGRVDVQGMGVNRLATWPPGMGLQQVALQQQWSPEMLSELYYNWNNMTSLSAAAAAAADAGASAEAAASAKDSNWRAVVQAAAAAASQWEVQKLNSHHSRDSGEPLKM